MGSPISLLLLLSNYLLLCTYFHFTEAQKGYSQPIAEGLSWNFYKSSCPQAETIVRKRLTEKFSKKKYLPPAFLRLHFNDCFINGCDGSALLGASATRTIVDGDVNGPYLSLKAEAFNFIEEVSGELGTKCGRVVSCADILALAARDAVSISGGPYYRIPLGRRDGLKVVAMEDLLASIPSPSSDAEDIISSFAVKNFTITDVVALSGPHTIGSARCSSFSGRLYPDQDPTMDKRFARYLKAICPSANSNNTAALDIRTPYTFDSMYYVDLLYGQGLFTSDQDLNVDYRTRAIVEGFSFDQDLFFDRFAGAMIKMSQLDVLTGEEGEVRANCSVRNSDNVLLSSAEAMKRGSSSAV